MRALLRPLVVRALRRPDDDVERAAAAFRIDRVAGRELVRNLGRAFLGGFNAMLGDRSTQAVADRGQVVPVHYRPFYFEGAAMGYLPRGYYDSDCTPARAEEALLGLDPRFRFLYYVGLGFWYGFRHAGRPERLEGMSEHLDPLYLPLCYDGFGFKKVFFDANGGTCADVIDRCPAERRSFLCQGMGRASFFVHMDDEEGFARYRETMPREYRWDVELGRSLARGFTGIDRADGLIEHVAAAGDDQDRSARLTGVTWALTARRMNDTPYFEACVLAAAPEHRALLTRLPSLCDDALRAATGYGDWQARTRDAVTAAHAAWMRDS